MLLSSSIQAEKIVIMKFTMMMHAMLWREGKMRINVYGAGLNRFAPVGISVNDDVRIFTIIVIDEFLCLATVYTIWIWNCIRAQIEEKPSESFILHLDSRIVLFALLHCLKIYQNVLFYNTSEAIDVYFQTS